MSNLNKLLALVLALIMACALTFGAVAETVEATEERTEGTLVYATCSVLKEENERQAEAFLARHPEFELSELPATVPERYRGKPGVGLQLLPDTDGVGFYICRMRRRRV